MSQAKRSRDDSGSNDSVKAASAPEDCRAQRVFLGALTELILESRQGYVRLGSIVYPLSLH
jgi:hypothetical protein